MKTLIAVAVAMLLVGCASTPEKIVPMPTKQTVPIPITSPTIVTDLQSASYNLDQAVAIGALAKDDPAPACLHDFLTRAGIDPTAPPATASPSFAPKNDGIASMGSIVYIQVQQAKQIASLGAPTVAQSCKTLLGQFVIDGATAAVQGAMAMNPISKAIPLLPIPLKPIQ